ncbi:MAG: acyl-CoA reductase [Firmicutes bacterium]|nr:acyl-CoA reductase [Melghirimyces thermohalophilus]MDA8352463.1 acyl-CoA reductase [Bacillota bacterium]
MWETAGYHPGLGETEVQWREQTFEQGGERRRVRVPVPDEKGLQRLVEVVRKNRQTDLASLSVSEVVHRIDQTVERLLDRNHPLRRRMEDWLPVVTGLAPDVIRTGLTASMKTFRKPQLLRWLAEDFGNPAMLDSFQPRVNGGFTRAISPHLLVHIWSGNVPGIPLWSLVSGLLVRSAQIGKVASAEPLMAGWFAQALEEVDPKLARCLAVVGWQGGDESRERLLFQEAEVVSAYGSNETLEAIQSRIPVTTRFLPHGHRFGLALVGKEALNPARVADVLRKAARDVAIYDQQGCYSPHCFYVEKGGVLSPRQFARMLAHELDIMQIRYPRRTLSPREIGEWNRWNQQAEWRALEGEEAEWIGGDGRFWSVAYEETGDASLLPTCLNRAVLVSAVNDLEEVAGRIAPFRAYLQTAGIAASSRRMFQLADRLAETGITRICALGHMTVPSSGWHHDGRPVLKDLVRLVDVEPSAEVAAEPHNPYSE